MRYQTFKTSQEKEINEFLAKYGDKLSRDSMVFFQDRICILYQDETDEELEKKGMIQGIKNIILQRKSELMAKEIELRYWRGLNLQLGYDKIKTQQNAEEMEKHKKNLLAQIHYAEQLLREVERDEFKV